MNEYLIGHIIKEIKIADDKKAIMFITDKEKVIARTGGNCCSNSWIENIEITASLPALVLQCEDIEMPDRGSPGGDFIAYYGYKIITNTGHIIIDYRNSSNGYYGGDLVFPNEYFYGGVFDQNISSEKWKDV